MPKTTSVPEIDTDSLGFGIARLSQGKIHGLKITLLAMNTSLATTFTPESYLTSWAPSLGLAEACAGRGGYAVPCRAVPCPVRVAGLPPPRLLGTCPQLPLPTWTCCCDRMKVFCCLLVRIHLILFWSCFTLSR